MEGIKPYQFYIKMKLHFKDKDVDFSKKQPKVTYESFQRRTDSYVFAKMSRMNDYRSYILANLIEDPSRNVRSFTNVSYLRMKKTMSSLTYKFCELLKKFKTKKELVNYLKVDNNKCFIMNDLVDGKIDIELLCILNNVFNLVEKYDEKSIFSVIYEKEITVIKKYSVFFIDNNKKYADIVKETYK